jgi:hypothetical protein
MILTEWTHRRYFACAIDLAQATGADGRNGLERAEAGAERRQHQKVLATVPGRLLQRKPAQMV